MPEQGLAKAQKLFAVVEGWIRHLQIRQEDLTVPVTVGAVATSISPVGRELGLAIPATCREPEPLVSAYALNDGMRGFTSPPVHQAGLHQLTAAVRSEDLHGIVGASTADISCRFSAAVYDLGRAFEGGAIRYPVRTRTLPLQDLKPDLLTLPLPSAPALREGTTAAIRLPIRRSPLQLSFLSAGEQLAFWKAALRQTRRTARELRLVGVYTAIPLGLAEGLRIDSQRGELLYQPSGSHAGPGHRLQDVAIFQDLVDDRVVIVTP